MHRTLCFLLYLTLPHLRLASSNGSNCYTKVNKKPHITGNLLIINYSVCTNIIQLPQVITHKKNEGNRTYGC